jgi:hypothetical protein
MNEILEYRASALPRMIAFATAKAFLARVHPLQAVA